VYIVIYCNTYTDEERTLFWVILPCQPDLKVTKLGAKSLTKSLTKITREDVERILSKGIDFQTLSKVLDHDISEVRDDVRDQLGPKSGTKSRPKSGTKSLEKMLELADFLQEKKSREALRANA